jgi:hypothetical protein
LEFECFIFEWRNGLFLGSIYGIFGSDEFSFIQMFSVLKTAVLMVSLTLVEQPQRASKNQEGKPAIKKWFLELPYLSLPVKPITVCCHSPFPQVPL